MTTPEKPYPYPRFIGVDSNGDFTWELESGRWTWGETPYDAATRQRTFTPDRYQEKYGPVTLRAPFLPTKKSPFPGAASAPAPDAVVDRGGSLGAAGERGAHRALKRLLDVLDGWIEGARSNHDALDHRGEPMGGECWTQFHPDDIRAMVNDAAREMGVAEPWSKPTP
jgi:hypothetical protein